MQGIIDRLRTESFALLMKSLGGKKWKIEKKNGRNPKCDCNRIKKELKIFNMKIRQ